MSEPKKRPKSVKPCKVWCPVDKNGDAWWGHSQISRKRCVEAFDAPNAPEGFTPFTYHQFTLTPVRRKKR